MLGTASWGFPCLLLLSCGSPVCLGRRWSRPPVSNGMRCGYQRAIDGGRIPLLRRHAAAGCCALVMTTPIFNSVEIAASVLPGVDELGSVLRRRGGLHIGPGGRHFFLITGEGPSQGAAIGIRDNRAA